MRQRSRSTAAAAGGGRDADRAPGAAIARPLLAWFARARRELPWREEPRDPYRTWVSEVMLQQTRVDVVLPYYARFLERFPTLEQLARAPLDEVLARWSGLGYYARARNLHEAAGAALARHGRLPATSAELRDLPGFGPYTAAAVASLAFGEQVALVDGNVARVLARLLRLEGDAAAVRARAWELAPGLLPPGKAGTFNEALMELGATVCTPRAPRCPECPLRPRCAGFARGDAERFPGPKPRKARPRLDWAAVCVRRGDGAVLLARRPPGALFEGMWDLPSIELSAPPDGPLFAAAAAEAARAALGPALRAEGLRLRGPLRPLGVVEQALTHREVRVHLFGAALAGPGRAAAAPPGEPADRGLRWVRAEATALAAVGLSSLARKALRACGLAAPRGAASARAPADGEQPVTRPSATPRDRGRRLLEGD